MIVLTNPVHLYGKKIIADLASRRDYFGRENSFCPLYEGMQSAIQTYWRTFDSEASFEYLYSEQADFDAAAFQPPKDDGNVYYDGEDEDEVGNYEKDAVYNPSVDTLESAPFYRRLEDISSKYIRKYMENLVYSIRNFNGGIKAFESRHRLQPCLINNSGDDPDDFTEFADLQLDQSKDEWPAEVYQEAITRMPYVLKRLHNLSKYIGVHMISYIASYVVSKDLSQRRRNSGVSTSVFKKNDVINHGVYLCNTDGNIVKKVEVQNKNKKAAFAFDWATGATQEYRAYYQDFLDFMHYCVVLNIDLEHDDMTRYQSEFIDKLVVTTVTPNSQYDSAIYNAIIHNSTNSSTAPNEAEDNVINTMVNFTQAIASDSSLSSVAYRHNYYSQKNNMENAKSIHYLYNIIYKNTIVDYDKYKWEDGYLYYDGELVCIDPNVFNNPNDRTEFIDRRCIVSELGYCVVVNDNSTSILMTLDNALANLQDKISVHDPDYKYAKWWVIGV